MPFRLLASGSQCGAQTEAEVSLATRTQPLLGAGEPLRQRLAGAGLSSPLGVLGMALSESASGGLGSRGRVLVARLAAPACGCFPKAPHSRPQPWTGKAEDDSAWHGPCCPGCQGYSESEASRAGSSQQPPCCAAVPAEGKGRRGPWTSQGLSFPSPLVTQPHPVGSPSPFLLVRSPGPSLPPTRVGAGC